MSDLPLGPNCRTGKQWKQERNTELTESLVEPQGAAQNLDQMFIASLEFCIVPLVLVGIQPLQTFAYYFASCVFNGEYPGYLSVRHALEQKKPPRNSLWCNHDDTASWNPPDDGPQSGRGIGPLSKVPRQIWQLNSQLNWFNWHITMFNPFGPFNWRTPCSLGVPVWCRWRSSWPFPKVGWYSYQIVSCGCIPWTLLFFQPAWIKSLVNSVKIPCGIMTWDGLQILIGGSWIKELVSCSLIISQKNGGLTCHPDSWHLVVPWSRGCHCMIRPR